jgi:hypothetical protein
MKTGLTTLPLMVLRCHKFAGLAYFADPRGRLPGRQPGSASSLTTVRGVELAGSIAAGTADQWSDLTCTL